MTSEVRESSERFKVIRFTLKLFSLVRILSSAIWLPHFDFIIRIFPSAFYHPHFIIRILSSAFYHPHFIIRIFPSAFFNPHFSIRIFPSAIRHPPSAAIRSALYRDPILSSAFFHPHFSIRIFPSAFFHPPSAIRHPPPSGPHFTETRFTLLVLHLLVISKVP